MVIKIPCEIYVKKYLIARYGTRHTITKNSFLGYFVCQNLTKDFDPKQKSVVGKAEYEIELTEWIFRNVGHSVSVNALAAIGQAFYLVFREDLYEYVRLEEAKGEKANRAIKYFLTKYNITEDDLKFETVHRDYKRKKQRKKGQQKKTSVNSHI